MRRSLWVAALGSCVVACDPGPTIANPDCIGSIEVEAGWFISGCDPDEPDCLGVDERQEVWLDAFELDACEVTVAQYQACIDDGACAEVEDHGCYDCNIHYRNRDGHPMNCGNAKRAEAYCAWVGGRIPTASEFEKASRGPDGRRFPWGNTAPRCDLLNYTECHEDDGLFGPSTSLVGSYPAGVSPYGAFDLAGNVREVVFLPPTEEGPRRRRSLYGGSSRDEYAQTGGSYEAPVSRTIPWAARFTRGGYTDSRAGFRCAYDVALTAEPSEPSEPPEPNPAPAPQPQ